MASDSPLLQTDSSQHNFQKEVSTTAPLAATAIAMTVLATRFTIDRTSNQNDLARHANKLRKKGWSEAKIQQSLRERTLAREKPRPDITESAYRWIKFLREILSAKRTPRIGLITHFYQGDIETEDFHINSTQTLVLTDLRQETILGLEDDVLYTFTG